MRRQASICVYMAVAGITDTSEVSGSGSSVGQITAPCDSGMPSPATFLNALMSRTPGLVLRFTSTGSKMSLHSIRMSISVPARSDRNTAAAPCHGSNTA